MGSEPADSRRRASKPGPDPLLTDLQIGSEILPLRQRYRVVHLLDGANHFFRLEWSQVRRGKRETRERRLARLVVCGAQGYVDRHVGDTGWGMIHHQIVNLGFLGRV